MFRACMMLLLLFPACLFRGISSVRARPGQKRSMSPGRNKTSQNERHPVLGLLQDVLADAGSVNFSVVSKVVHQLENAPSEIPAVAAKLSKTIVSEHGCSCEFISGCICGMESWRSKLKSLTIIHELMHNIHAVQVFSTMPDLRIALGELRTTTRSKLGKAADESIRTLSTEILKACFVKLPPKPPGLGRYKNSFSLDEFIARGGEAEVWKATDLKTNQQVVIRFPLSLCMSWPCPVDELPEETLRDMTTACEMSSIAVGRYKDRSSTVPSLRQSPFANCVYLQAERARKNDPAFDVWEFVGEVSMAQGFFMSSRLGPLSLGVKRQILFQLTLAVAVATDETESGAPCCCYHGRFCTTDFAARTSWTMTALMKVTWQRCPEEWIEKPGRCGPIVHHDINFDNVMLAPGTSGKKQDLIPTLIDFSGARRCRMGPSEEDNQWSPSYSKNWVPFWLSDPHLWSKTECWSYDIYAVGLAWLVMELLREMPSQHLICNAAASAGLIRHSSLVFRWGGSTNAKPVKLVHGCDSFEQDELLRHDAMRPINLLITELKNRVLHHESLASPVKFVPLLQEFVASGKKSCPDEVRSLPLLLPDEDVLTNTIYPLLKECPRFPRINVMKHTNIKNEMQCHARIIIANLKPKNRLSKFQEMTSSHACKELSLLVEEFPRTALPVHVLDALNLCKKEWPLFTAFRQAHWNSELGQPLG